MFLQNPINLQHYVLIRIICTKVGVNFMSVYRQHRRTNKDVESYHRNLLLPNDVFRHTNIYELSRICGFSSKFLFKISYFIYRFIVLYSSNECTLYK